MNQQRVTPTIFLSLYAGLVLLVAGLLGFTEWKTREDIVVQAQDKARALANLAAEHMLRMVEINDIALRNAIKYFSLRNVDQSGGIWADWHNLAHLEGSGIAGEVSQVRYMLIIGADGIVRLHSHRFPAVPQSVKGLDYFDVQAAIPKLRNAGPLFVGEPLMEDGGTELYLPISRRIGRPDTGAFSGVVAAAIRPEISNRFFESLSAGQQGILFLMHANGTILSSNPFRGDLVAHKLANPKLLAEIRRQEDSGAPKVAQLASECCFDQHNRIIASRQISALPLYVAVGLAEQDILEEWRESLNKHVTMAAVVLLSFTGLVLVMLRQYRKQVLAHGLLSETYDAAGTGFCMVDGSGRVVRANAAYGALCGVGETELVYRPFTEIFPPDDRNRAHELLRAAGAGETQAPMILKLRHSDGRSRRVLITAGAFSDASGRLFLVVAANDVTERERQEERLRENERRLRQAQRIAGIGWWTIELTSGRVVWSDTLYDIWGWDPGILPTLENWRASIHADDRARLNDGDPTDGPDSTREYRIVRPDGTERHVREEFTRSRDETDQITRLFGIIQDVTELRQNERALADSKARLRAVLDVAVTGIIVHDDKGHIQLFNPAAEQLFGYRAAEAKGLTIDTLIPPMPCSALANLPHLGVAREVIARTRDGRTFPAYLAVGDYVDDGKSMSVGVLMDISDQKRREQEIFQARDRLEQQAADLSVLARKLDQARREAEEARGLAEAASRAKSEFLAHMSHELRTPLNAILGFSEIMDQGYFGPLGSPRYSEYNRNVLDSARHLLSLINDILDLSKIEAGRYELEEEQVDLSRIIEPVVRLVRERALRKDLTLRSEIEPLPVVMGDERALKQILINLLTNAVKFTERGGEIEVSGRQEENGDVMLAVRDTGIGIAADQIPKVLEPFGQARNAYMAGESGTGLGLPITRSLVNLHGGSLAIDSVLGVGTTVTIRLPALRVVQQRLIAAV
ncbi:MAG TPA: PAS domain S-box protein [Skermanella sp.]|nr:PAS domain S-box protein [Skermanella sp.]